MKQYVVIGLGRFGISVARTLTELRQEVLAIDADEERVRHAAQEVTRAIQADATDANALMSLGVRNSDVGIVSIGRDVQANILTTLLLKEMGVPYVVAKAANQIQGKVLEKVGADRIVYPEREMGNRIARNLVLPTLLDYIDLAKDYRIEEVIAPPFMHGKSLRELNLRNTMRITVIVIKRAGGEDLVVSPGADVVFSPGDTMVVLGRNEDLNRLSERLE